MINFGECKSLADFIKIVALNYGDKTALKFRPKFRSTSFSYEAIYQLAITYCRILKNKGVKKGDRVIIWAANSPYWVAGFFGIQLAGAVAVPVNFASSQNFIEKISQATDAKIILKSATLPSFENGHCEFQDLETINLPSGLAEFSQAEIAANDLAEIVYTSGTTGFPKGVCLTHGNILANLAQISSVIQLTENDRGLSILPLSHMFEQIAGMFAPLAAGAQITYATALNSIQIRKNLVEDKITKMAAVPEFLKLTLKRLEDKARQEGKEKILNLLFAISNIVPMLIRRVIFRSILKRFGGYLNTIFSGGAALDPQVGKKWEALGIYILQGYGTTEASPVISANRYWQRKIASVGKPLPGVEVKIAKDGEILVKGANIFPGYWQDRAKTGQVFDNGWYKTGDVGFIDKDGHLYIRGRKKYMIVTTAGVNVYPEDIEYELNKFASVEDSCVVGLRKGDRLLIHAVLLAPAIKNPAEMISKVNQKLEAHQQIQDYSSWPFDDFPRTVTKKVKRDEVQKFLETQKIEAEEVRSMIGVGVVEKILAKITGLPAEKITGGAKLVEDLKMDSLERVELVALIEEETGIILDEAEIGPQTTVFDIVKKVEKKFEKVERHEFKQWPLTWAILVLRKTLQNLLVGPLTRYFAKIEVEGVENLKGQILPVIFYSNHLSSVDPALVVTALPEKFRKNLAIAAAADRIFEDPKYKKWEGILTFLLNIYPFARRGQVKSSLEYTGRLLDRGFSILAFPEGAVSPTGKLQPLQPGAGFLAVEMGVPVVPIKISGTAKIVPPGVSLPVWPKKGEVKIKFGTPLEFPPQTSYLAATEKIEKVMIKM